ncbi:MAG: hypothetical protein M1820_000386 [Bogoriella megaspora]|nr:MAG: hypothetical protein M1820_000386 [Bogoriella megaspora]
MPPKTREDAAPLLLHTVQDARITKQPKPKQSVSIKGMFTNPATKESKQPSAQLVSKNDVQIRSVQAALPVAQQEPSNENPQAIKNTSQRHSGTEVEEATEAHRETITKEGTTSVTKTCNALLSHLKTGEGYTRSKTNHIQEASSGQPSAPSQPNYCSSSILTSQCIASLDTVTTNTQRSFASHRNDENLGTNKPEIHRSESQNSKFKFVNPVLTTENFEAAQKEEKERKKFLAKEFQNPPRL